MQFTIPNSAGFPDLDEANAESSHGWLTRQLPRPGKKRRMREHNDCHAPDSGRFCAGQSFGHRMDRQRTSGKRAVRVMRKLDRQMTRVGGDVDRAAQIRRRMDVAGPMATRHKQNTLIGTFKRILGRDDARYRGKKR